MTSSIRRGRSLKGSLENRFDLVELDKEACRRDLREFTRQAWPSIESPARPFIDNWHIGAITEHLQAVTNGEVRALIINVPPGTMKSLLTCVLWQAWEWGPRDMPWTRWLCASYSGDIAVRDARKARRLLQSEWYQKRWGSSFAFCGDQNAQHRFENTKTGYRISTGISGLGTGERADRIVVDDPHNVKGALSDVQRQDALTWWDETSSTRASDPRTAAWVIIMQRLHENDLSGHVMAEGTGAVQLMLPMRFEPERACYTRVRPKRTTEPEAPLYRWDPRTVDGELLFPERFPEEELQVMEKRLNIYGVASQMQMRPAPRGGGMIDTAMFEVVDAIPADVRFVRYWDLAGTKKTASNRPAYTAGVLMGTNGRGAFYIGDVTRFQKAPAEVEATIKATATRDGLRVRIGLPQDPGQAGKAQAMLFVRMLAPHVAVIHHESGDKVTRALGFAAQVGAGNVKLLRGEWNRDFIAECSAFPVSTYKDQVDACSGAFFMLAEPEPTMTERKLSG